MNKKTYSPSEFGRDAEFVTALYLISRGWEVKLSKGSKGPADLRAKKDLILLYIQIKASTKLPRIKGSAVTQLKNKSFTDGALPVVATLQPIFPCVDKYNKTIINNDSSDMLVEKKGKMDFKIYFYDLTNWSNMNL